MTPPRDDDVVEEFMCMFLNPIPHTVAAHFIRCRRPGTKDVHAEDHCACCWSESETVEITIPNRHTAMIHYLEQWPHDKEDALHVWLLRGVGMPGYWEGDFGPADGEAHAAFYARFGSWRLPVEIHRCLTGRMDPASLGHCPRLHAAYGWLREHAVRLHPGCAIPRALRYDNAVRGFMARYALLPHAVALQFCLTRGERNHVKGVAKFMAFGDDSTHPSLDPVRRWVMRSAGWDLSELPVPGVGSALLCGLQRSGYLGSWSRLPYAVALHVVIGPGERAMADWLTAALTARHPAILRQSTHTYFDKPDRVMWQWLVKSVGRRGCDHFRNRRLHRAFFVQFGSWRLPDDVVERLDHRSGTWGLSDVLAEMYEWMIQHDACCVY